LGIFPVFRCGSHSHGCIAMLSMFLAALCSRPNLARKDTSASRRFRCFGRSLLSVRLQLISLAVFAAQAANDICFPGQCPKRQILFVCPNEDPKRLLLLLLLRSGSSRPESASACLRSSNSCTLAAAICLVFDWDITPRTEPPPVAVLDFFD
jgi:hypothetical protein